MEQEIMKLVYDYSKRKEIIDEKCIEKIIETIINAWSLDDYVSGISWENRNEINANGIAAYHFLNHKLIFFQESLEKELEDLSKYDFLFGDIEVFFYRNLTIIKYIFHELEHAYQNKILDSNQDDLEAKLIRAASTLDLFYKKASGETWRSILGDNFTRNDALSYINKLEIWKEQFYVYDPTERLAEIRALEKIWTITKEVEAIFPNLNQFEKQLLLNGKFRGYSIEDDHVKCPTQIYLIGTGEENTKLWTELDFYDPDEDKTLEKAISKNSISKRLTYGLPISSEEYEDIYSDLYRK